MKTPFNMIPAGGAGALVVAVVLMGIALYAISKATTQTPQTPTFS